MSARAPPCPCVRRSWTCELCLWWQHPCRALGSHQPLLALPVVPGAVCSRLALPSSPHCPGTCMALGQQALRLYLPVLGGEEGCGCRRMAHRVAWSSCCPHGSDSSWAPLGTSTAQIHKNERDVSPLCVPVVSEVVCNGFP